MKRSIYVLIYFLSSILFAQTSTKITSIKNTEGVSLSMATYRSKQLKDITYNLSFKIPENRQESIASSLLIKTSVTDLSHPLYLDFKEDVSALKSIKVNKKKVPIVFDKEHIIINQEWLNTGNNSIEIIFIAGELSLNRNSDYLYTLLVPDRARTLFPCFDQPDLKAEYKLSITAPKHWEVLCGATLKEKNIHDNTITYQFGKTDKMSTYLFSFVVGKFDKLISKTTQQSMEMLHRETNLQKIKASEQPIFNLHQASLDFLEAYTQYNFPFQKFDFAVIPGFQYRGMEHVGAVQYRASSMFLDESATRNQELFRAKLIAHETAHMWFGNLVTMHWFNDVWMKEVFANFMADKIINPEFKDINHELQFLTSHYPRAYCVDRTKGTNPIRQHLTNLNNAGSLYGSIIYNKAPIMMRQLEFALGTMKFKEGVQEYIKTYANSNADWNDLVNILDSKTTLDLKEWSEVWVNSSGRPIFNAEIAYENNNTFKSFRLTQHAEDGSDKLWPQLFDISLVYADTIKTIPINSNAKNIFIPEVLGLPKPEYILYNSNAYGYGVFPANENKIKQIAFIKNEVSRAQEYINSFEVVLNGNIDKIIAFESFKKGLEIETNEQILLLLTNTISKLFWNYFEASERLKYQTDLENVLLTRLQSNNTSKNSKKTIFKAYQNIAYSNTGKSTLFKIWNKEYKIENLILNQDDYTKLAQVLALYRHPKADAILLKAKNELTNPDKIKRFDFLKPALSFDPVMRHTFFESFKDLKNREKESWVLIACGFLHHPLQQKIAIKSVAQSLNLLEEIQKTGDIFFPKGWLDNTIGQYASKEAYLLVEDYLKKHKDLDANLKRKLLQASDQLLRKYQKKD